MTGFDPSRGADLRFIRDRAYLEAHHAHYGPCDGFGPLWTCSACTGIIACSDGTFSSIFGGEIDRDEAAAIVGDFLLEKAERAALEAMGCCDSPALVSDYMRVALIMSFPGNPWRHEKLATDAIAIEAAPAGETAKTGSTAKPRKRGPSGIAQNQSDTDTKGIPGSEG